MSDIYSFRDGPTYRGASQQEMFDAAMSTPLSLTSTLVDQAKGGVLESFGLGTAIKDLTTPQGNETPSLAEPIFGMAAIPVPGAYSLLKTGVQALTDQGQSLSEDAYKASPSYRKDIPWDAGMTDTRAAALASFDDAKKVREFYATKRPFAAFLGNLAGQAVDPLNYVPIFDEVVAAAAVARFGKVAGRALVGGGDAAINTGAFGLASSGERGKFGDDVSWAALTSQMATAALIGGAFGTLHGVFGEAPVDPRLRAEAEARLSTLRTVQESRIALNEGIDAVVRGEDVRLSPNATEPMVRVAGEVANLSKAYDEVKANPTGNVRDPLVAITPDDIEGTLVARGAFKDINNLEFSDRGYGLVKIIWGHGEHSPSRPEFQITKEDITAFPNVIRNFDPAKVSADGARREWRVQSGDRTVVYADKVMKGDRHLVTAYVQEPDKKGFDQPLSKERASQSVPSGVSTTPKDTAGGLSAGLPGVTKRPDTNIAQRPTIDNTIARPEPAPEGIKQAEASIAKPEDAKNLADQYRVDPQTGSFPEEADLHQLSAEGRFTEHDATTMAQAQADYETGSAFAEALKSVAGCLI